MNCGKAEEKTEEKPNAEQVQRKLVRIFKKIEEAKKAFGAVQAHRKDIEAQGVASRKHRKQEEELMKAPKKIMGEITGLIGDLSAGVKAHSTAPDSKLAVSFRDKILYAKKDPEKAFKAFWKNELPGQIKAFHEASIAYAKTHGKKAPKEEDYTEYTKQLSAFLATKYTGGKTLQSKVAKEYFKGK